MNSMDLESSQKSSTSATEQPTTMHVLEIWNCFLRVCSFFAIFYHFYMLFVGIFCWNMLKHCMLFNPKDSKQYHPTVRLSINESNSTYTHINIYTNRIETRCHNTKSETQHFCIKELNEGLSPRWFIEKFYTTVWFCIGYLENLHEIPSNRNVFMYIDEDIFLL